MRWLRLACPRGLEHLLLLAALLLLLTPTGAWAAPPTEDADTPGQRTTNSCARLSAIDALEPSERSRLEALLCPDGTTPMPGPAGLDSVLRGLINGGDWASLIALEATRTLGVQPRQDAVTASRRALDAMLANPKCTSLRSFFDEQIARGLAGKTVSSPRSAVGAAPRACTAAVAAEDLAALSEVVLVGYYGGAKDAFEAVIADPSPAYLGPVEYLGADGKASILPLPRGAAAVVFVAQADVALPWRRALAPGHGTDFALAPQAQPECLEIEFAAPLDDQPWYVVVDGVEFEVTVAPEPGRAYAVGRLDLVDIPPGSHEVHFVHNWAERGREQVETTGSRTSCALVEADLRGLRPGYGLTQLAIDDQCRDRGLVPAQVRKLVDRYFSARSVDLYHLDVIVDVISSFESIESNLDASAPTGPDRLDSSERQLAAYSGELMRQGVAKILTLSVSCAELGDDMVIVGQVIDLERLSERERSRTAGIDISEILEARTAIVEARTGRRQGFEEVLGGLLGQPTVHLRALPDEVEFHDELQIGYRIERGDAPRAEFEFGMTLVQRDDICARAEDLATLTDFDYDQFRDDVEAQSHGAVVKRERHVLDPSAGSEHDAHHRRTFELTAPFSGSGRYLIWVRELESDALSAACVQVSAREVAVFGQLGGLTASRPGAQWVQRMYYMRFDVGMLFPVGARKIGRFGGQIGYTNTAFDTEAPPSWDDINIGTIGDFESSGESHMRWTRHAMSFAAIAGFEVPLGACGYPFRPRSDDPQAQAQLARLARRCAKPFHRRWSFAGRLLIGGSFGFHDVSKIPAGFSVFTTSQSESKLISDFDFEVGAQFLVTVRFSRRFGVYVFHQVTVNDLDSLINGDVEGRNTVTDNFATLNLVGVGFAWMRRPR